MFINISFRSDIAMDAEPIPIKKNISSSQRSLHRLSKRSKTGNMLRTFLLIFLCVSASVPLGAQVTNQNLYDTLPNLVDHYKKRTAEFQKEPVVTGRIIFLGNSITEGGKWSTLLGDKTIVNRGIGGDVTFGVINRLDDITIRKPSKLFIMIGINDISKDFPDVVIIDNYRKIIQEVKLKSPETKIFVQTLLPVNPSYPRFPQHYDKSDHVISVNNLLRQLSLDENIGFINLYPLFLDTQGRMDARYTYDGLHLNDEGYKLWASFLKDNKYL
jgi:lysophospholipase L1-like esterase